MSLLMRRKAAVAAPTSQKKGYGMIRQGLKQLHPPPGSDKATDLDIVFVPGLGAHPENSWKSTKTDFNWAIDDEGIARDFPNARVLLYMYQSAWNGPFKVKQFMDNLGHTLLEGLNAEREASGSTRPIVFIGHSMGGLVTAKAICLAESRQDLFPHMFEDIAGCAFFGTPFEGADAASAGAILAPVGEKFNQTVSSKLLDFMKPGDEGLRELREEFVRVVTKLSPKIALCGFWEEQPTKLTDLSGVPEFLKSLQIPLPKRIAEFVTRQSAILGGNMEAMGLAANHRDLVKFESSKDKRYALMRSPLKRIIHGAQLLVKVRRQSTRHIDRDLVKKAMETLDGAQVWRKRKSIAVKPSSWVPDEPDYFNWLAKADHAQESSFEKGDCLWIRGPEGRGKTSASLAALEGIEETIKTNPNTAPVLLTYFFCDSMPDYDTAEDVLKSLVRQLIEQQESLASYAKFLLRKKGRDEGKGQSQLTVENLWQVLQDQLTDVDLAGGRVYFVINNLDALRSDSDSTKTLVELLGLEMTENMNSGRDVMVRWLITSGQSWSIGQALKGDHVRLIDLEDEKYEDRVQLELRRHAHQKVSDLVTQKNYSKALAYYAGSLIGRRAQNTQWIDITIVQLQQLPEHESDLRVRLHLEVVPQKLDELLTATWRRVFELNREDADEIKEMLRVLVLTYEDPTEAELRLLTGLYSTEEQREELDKLVEKCKPLLSTKKINKSETRVCFIEGVVRAHLLENAHRLLGLSDEDIKLQHGMLGFRAFSHIMDIFDFPAVEPQVEDDAPQDDGEGEGEQEVEAENQEDTLVTEEHQDEVEGAATEPGEDQEEHEETRSQATGKSDSEDQNEQEDNAQSEGEAQEEDDTEEEESSSDEADVEDEDPEAPQLKDMALAYAVKHWLPHASKATAELADALSHETEFWKRDSAIRRRWLTEHNRLTDSFKYYDRTELSGLHIAAAIGYKGLVEALMKNGHENEKSLQDAVRFTPLHFAAKFGQCDIIEYLLDKEAPVDDGKEGGYMTPLHMAAAAGKVKAMGILLKRGADPNADCGTYGGVINAAIESGNPETVKLLVEHNVSLVAVEVGEEGDEERTSEHEEQEQDGEEPAEGEDEEEKDGSENENEDEEDDEGGGGEEEDDDDDDEELIRSPLALAALRSDLTMFEFLLKEYSDRLPPKEIDSALTHAASGGRLEAFKRLFSSYEHTEEALQESLDEAAGEENWDIVALLLEHTPGLSCDSAFKDAATGYDEQQEIQILEAMWEYTGGSIASEVLDEALYNATDYENGNTVQLLLRFGASADATGEEYGNALTAAAYDGTAHIVTMLLEASANVNSPDGWALQTAAAEGHREIVELLLEHGADVNASTDHEGMPQKTALQAAVEAGNLEIVDLLLSHDANPDLGGGDLTCPVIAAATKGEKDILQRLIDAKADIDVFGGPYNSSPLTYAAMYLPKASICSLLDAGANIDLADKDGDTALILAAWFGDHESVQFLLDRSANVLLRNHEGKNALQIALEKEKLECVKILVAHVSAIMEALRVAVEKGDAGVTAVMRSVENRKQELDYED